MENTIRELMTTDPATVRQGATIDEAMAILLEKDAAEVYVTDVAGRLQGVVPDYELLKARMAQTSGQEPIEKLMSQNVATVHPDSPVDAIMAPCRESCRRVIAVCEAGRLIGQVGRRDVLRLIESLRSDKLETISRAASCSPEAAAENRVSRYPQSPPATRILSMQR